MTESQSEQPVAVPDATMDASPPNTPSPTPLALYTPLPTGQTLGVPPTPPPVAGGAYQGELPALLARRWNWGAFFLLPFWAGAMRLWHLVFISIGACILSIILDAVAKDAGRIVNLPILLYTLVVARHGNAWAWKSRQWQSVEQFVAVQRAWGIWSAVIGLALVGLTLAAALLLKV